jgi:hypothetical protein
LLLYQIIRSPAINLIREPRGHTLRRGFLLGPLQLIKDNNA